jgi:hypothetical protein
VLENDVPMKILSLEAGQKSEYENWNCGSSIELQTYRLGDSDGIVAHMTNYYRCSYILTFFLF